MRVIAPVLLLTISGLATEVAAQAKIPLRDGLTIVTAISEARGDYESIKRVAEVTAETLRVFYSADDVTGKQRRLTASRVVRRQDIREAREYLQTFTTGDDKLYPGTTALGPSSAVIADLQTKGEASFACQTRVGRGRRIRLVRGVLKAIGSVKFPALVDGTRVELDAIHAKGQLEDIDAEFHFLNDPDHPVTLRYRLIARVPADVEKMLIAIGKEKELATLRGMNLGEHSLDVIKIDTATPDPIEEKLATDGRAEVHGIYFDFGSATVRPESRPVIEEIASLLKKNPAWTLSIEGHTDNVGADKYNLELSTRRAEAVRQTLIQDHVIAGDRLATAGHGSARPLESNDTMAGRARNRRVELVRR